MSRRAEAVVTLVNPQGLHARPSTLIVKCANGFSSRISMTINGRTADCRSVMEVMMLASPSGTRISLEAEGEDADEAVRALVKLIQGGFGEAYR